MKLRKSSALMAAVALVAGTAACSTDSSDSGAGASGDRTLQIMMFPSVAYRLPVVIAQEKGYFDDEDVTVNVIAQPNNLQGIQAMEATNSQAGMMSVSTLAQGSQAGSDVQMFCGGLDTIQSSILAPADSDLPSVSEGASPDEVFSALSGLKVGAQTPVGSGFHKMLEAALTDGGMDGATWVNVGGANTVTQASLQNGSVDVAQTSPSGTQMLIETGVAKELVYMPDVSPLYGDSYGSGWVGPTSWLKDNADTAKAFCDATAKAIEFINDPANREEVLPIMMKDSGINDEAIAEAVLETYGEYSADVSEAQLATALDQLRELDITTPEPKLEASKLLNTVGR